MYFDDDLIDFGVASGAAGADEGDDDDYAWHEGTGSGASPNSSSVQTLEVSSATPRRKRGSRGGSQKAASDKEKDVKRWRSGAIPPAPVFDGDIAKDPYCLRHYKRKLGRWLKITREFLPPNEQALRALEQLKGEAELEFEEVDDSKLDCKDGVAKLIKDLEVSFGERELFRQGGTIREFEQVCRLQGESVSAFIRRFRLLERKLKDNRVPPYPEQARVVKLLDGLRLDDKSVSSVLLAAGNQYDMTKVLEALRIQYPAGMTITGIPRARQDPRTARGRGSTTSSRSSTSTSSTRSTASTRSTQSGRRWRHWHTNADDDSYEWYQPDAEETEAWDLPQEDDAELVVADHEETVLPDIPEEENENFIQDEEPLYEEAEWAAQDQDPVSDMLAEAAQALTVTSKKLAGLAQARGFYQPKGASSTSSGKGKGKKGSSSSGKGKGKHGKSGNKGAGKSKGKGKGKLDAQSALQQQRLQGSLCLGCGSADHWLRDCPNFNVQNAQLASASVTGLCLDADGAVEHYSSWTASTNVDACVTEQDDSPNVAVLRKKKVYFKLPPLHEFEPKVDRPPNVLLQYCEGPCSAYIIADTGCQRQVAGKAWHDQKALEILPLKRLEFPDKCKFSFGPSAPVASVGRNVYPVAIAGVHFSLSVSVVIAKAPALLSRRAFEALGAVPDVHTGTIYFRALQCTSKLWLSPCGHLAIRLDEWGDQLFSWPPRDVPRDLPDIIHPAAFDRPSILETTTSPAQPPPHASGGPSAMVGPLASVSSATAGVREQRPANGAAVFDDGPERQSEGPHPEELWGPIDSHHGVEYSGSSGGSDGADEPVLPEEAGPVQPLLGTSGRDQGEDMRSLRIQMGGDAKWKPSAGNTKSLAAGQNASRPAGSGGTSTSQRARGQEAEGEGRRRGIHARVRGPRCSIPRLLASLLNILAGICSGSSSGYGYETVVPNGTIASQAEALGSSGSEATNVDGEPASIGQRPNERGPAQRGHLRPGLDQLGGAQLLPRAQRRPAGRLGGQPIRSERPADVDEYGEEL